MKLVEMKCNNCGSSLKFKDNVKEVTCEYCGTHYKLEDDYDKGYKFEKGRIAARNEKEGFVNNKKSVITVFVVAAFIIFLAGIIILNVATEMQEEIDPFEYIEIMYSGTSGSGRAYPEIILNDKGINKNNLFITLSKENNLTENETITVNVSSYSYKLLENRKEFTVSGLDTYLTDLDNISKKDLKVIHEKTKEINDRNLSTFTLKNYISSRKFVKLLLLTDGKNSNTLYDVEKVVFDFNGDKKTIYLVVYYNNIIIRDSEDTSINYRSAMYTGNIISLPHGAITAYESIKSIKTNIKMKEEKEMKLLERDL